MKVLSQVHIDNVLKGLSGKRKDKLVESIAAINQSVEACGWLKNTSRKANSGFYQGVFSKLPDFARDYDNPKHDNIFDAYMCLKFGQAMSDPENINSYLPEELFEKFSKEFYLSWAMLCSEAKENIKLLNDLRPLPVITSVGLSPKVTATLKEMNLDLDMSSIKFPKIGKKRVPLVIKGVEQKNSDGSKKMTWAYFIDWTKGILHNESRFSGGHCHCHACGKLIPSAMFVPIEAKDNKSGKIISMWLGQDCARSIFGVRDIGFKNKGEV